MYLKKKKNRQFRSWNTELHSSKFNCNKVKGYLWSKLYHSLKSQALSAFVLLSSLSGIPYNKDKRHPLLHNVTSSLALKKKKKKNIVYCTKECHGIKDNRDFPNLFNQQTMKTDSQEFRDKIDVNYSNPYQMTGPGWCSVIWSHSNMGAHAMLRQTTTHAYPARHAVYINWSNCWRITSHLLIF